MQNMFPSCFVLTLVFQGEQEHRLFIVFSRQNISPLLAVSACLGQPPCLHPIKSRCQTQGYQTPPPFKNRENAVPGPGVTFYLVRAMVIPTKLGSGNTAGSRLTDSTTSSLPPVRRTALESQSRDLSSEPWLTAGPARIVDRDKPVS